MQSKALKSSKIVMQNQIPILTHVDTKPKKYYNKILEVSSKPHFELDIFY